MRFWDSSAIIPLVVREKRSALSERWLGEDVELVLWTLTQVELVSAIRRLAREGRLDERQAMQAEAVAGEIAKRAHIVVDLERVKALAARLLRVHPLRAADSLQLGAALAWADGDPEGNVFHTFDQRLRLAAQREGLAVPHA